MKNNLTPEECNRVIKYHDTYNKISIFDYKHNQGIKKNVIDYNISIVPRDNETQWMFNKVHTWLLSEYPNNIVNEMDIFYNFEYYPEMKFEKHIDKQRDCSWHLVVGATLNSDFTGGELILYEPDGVTAKNPGELYSISAERPHAVTPIIEGVRYSFVFFISKYWLGIPKSVL